MRILISSSLLLAVSVTPAFAGSCPDDVGVGEVVSEKRYISVNSKPWAECFWSGDKKWNAIAFNHGMLNPTDWTTYICEQGLTKSQWLSQGKPDKTLWAILYRDTPDFGPSKFLDKNGQMFDLSWDGVTKQSEVVECEQDGKGNMLKIVRTVRGKKVDKYPTQRIKFGRVVIYSSRYKKQTAPEF